MYKYIIFDVDGTIIDTEEAVLKSLQAVLEEQGHEYELNDLRFALGIPGKNTLRRLNVNDIDRVHPRWAQLQLEFSDDVTVFSEMEEVIQHLAERVNLGIVTSKTSQELIDEFDPFGLSKHFEHSISADDTEKHKPEPDPLLLCMERMNAEPNQTIYIGDSVYDMQSAQKAGIKFGLALWGSKTSDKFEEADYIFEEPKDILKLLDS